MSRDLLLEQVDGFAKLAETNGAGIDGQLYVVTSTADSGAGTLREGLEQGGRWVTFDKTVFPAVRETVIGLNSAIQIGNNTTLDGRCSNVHVQPSRSAEGGLFVGYFGERANENVIITNVKIGPVPGRGDGQSGDGIRVVWGSDRFFITHVEITSANDEAIEVSRGDKGPMRGTISYSHISTTRKAVLIGDQTGNNEKGGGWTSSLHRIQVTIHHNWFQGNAVRNPLVTDSDGHLYNNYVDSYGLRGNEQASAGQEFGGDAWVWTEYNVIEPPDGGDPCGIHVVNYGSLGVTGISHITARGNVFRKNARFCPLFDPDPKVPIAVPYKYAPEEPGPDGTTLTSVLTSSDGDTLGRAGWINAT
ncbi:MAG: hypothetical protein ABIQ73_30370 [Acidimicrobiales bacterium]